jgi:hypothetical protein
MQSSQPLGDKWKKSAYTSMSMHARLVIRSKLIARVGCAGEVCLLARRGQFQVALMVAFRFCGEFLSSFACSRIELWVWNGRFPGLEVREGEPSTTCFADISSSSLATGIKDTPCLACIRVARLVVVGGWHAGRQVQSYDNPSGSLFRSFPGRPPDATHVFPIPPLLHPSLSAQCLVSGFKCDQPAMFRIPGAS